MFRQSELATGSTQTVDDLDGHDVGRADGAIALRHVTVHDLVQSQELP